MEGDRECVGVISWMKGHEHYSDLCIIGVLDFLFTLLFLSTVVFQVCWQKKSNYRQEKVRFSGKTNPEMNTTTIRRHYPI